MTKKKKIVLISLVLVAAICLFGFYFFNQQSDVVKLDCPKELSYNKKGEINQDVINKMNNGMPVWSWNTSCGRIYLYTPIPGGDGGYNYYDYKGDRIATCDTPFGDAPFHGGGPICEALRPVKSSKLGVKVK